MKRPLSDGELLAIWGSALAVAVVIFLVMR